MDARRCAGNEFENRSGARVKVNDAVIKKEKSEKINGEIYAFNRNRFFQQTLSILIIGIFTVIIVGVVGKFSYYFRCYNCA